MNYQKADGMSYAPQGKPQPELDLFSLSEFSTNLPWARGK
jgi:hypothetical protein